MEQSTYHCRPVGRDNWQDLEELFEGRGGPHHCWCTVWRTLARSAARPDKTVKKATLRRVVDAGRPIGLLAYRNGTPAGWCSVAPRESYRALGGDPGLEGVWSLVCFFVPRAFRGQQLGSFLLNEAIAYAKGQGGRYLEAYPVDPDSPAYRFMGFRPWFERRGFRFRGRAGKRRYVMVLPLQP